MELMLTFIAGIVVAYLALFLWAWFKIQPDLKNMSNGNAVRDAHLTRLPFDGGWYVFSGGEKAEQNTHHGFGAQNFAIDFVICQDGVQTKRTDGKTNEDYYCWDQSIYAAHDGTVVISVDGIPDNRPKEMNPQMVYGNVIMIQDSSGFVSVYAHLKNGTVSQRAGDMIKSGDRLGTCGNSGNSSEPHLHFHVQSEVGFEKGLSIRSLFTGIKVNNVVMKSHSPVKAEIVSP
jgi:Peptidase family M23